MKIVADAHIPFVNEYFGGCGELVFCVGRTLTRADLKDADILLVRSVTPVNASLLEHTRVKFVGSVTAGADHLDTEWLDQAGIAWTVASGFNAPPVADYVVSVLAALAKEKHLVFTGTAKNAAHNRFRAAVFGVGHVGRLVVEKLKLLNFEVILCDPLRAEKEPSFTSTPIEDIADVDFISLNVPLTRHGPHPTYHFIERKFLSRQKPGCIVLNASRGAVINLSDMHYGKHLTWCFDVWEHEPYIDKGILAQAFIATPHIAGYSVQSKIRGIAMIYRIACEKKLIPPQQMSPLFMQDQSFCVSSHDLDWQDVVLEVFNPYAISKVMRNKLLQAKDRGKCFDAMRNQFNSRYEFAYTKILNANLLAQDRIILEKLGMKIDPIKT